VANSFFGDLAGALPKLGGAIEAGRGLFDTAKGKSTGLAFDPRYVEETTEKLDQRAADTLQQIRDVFSEVGQLTGIGTADAVQNYMNRYKDYFEPTIAKYSENVYGFQPDITKSYTSAAGRIDDMTKQYSLLNRPGYMEIAKNPSVVKVDPSAITSIATDYYTSPQAAKNYDYSGPQTQALIRGRPGAIDEIASAYANPNVKALMSYNY
jgi:hypothetical protein